MTQGPKRDTTSGEFFEAKYRQDPDPWQFAASPYELHRYSVTMAALAKERYGRAFEPGCATGVLTERLGAICEEVRAIEISPTAVEAAQARCRHLSNVRINCGKLPEDIPAGEFDLVVFSEIGYYFVRHELVELSRELTGRLIHSGTFLAVHWLGQSEDHLLTGDAVHEALATLPGLAHEHAERHPGFRLDRWRRI